MTRHNPNHIILRSFPGMLLLSGQDDKMIGLAFVITNYFYGEKSVCDCVSREKSERH